MITRKLRTRKPINYYEPEEPAHDAYEFCEQCNDFVEEFCTIHGGLLVIPDDKVPTGKARPALPRAMLTVPAAFLYIDSSSIPGAGLGVFAKESLPRGARFGPYRGRRLPAPASDYGWQVTGRGAHVCDGADAARSNWMRYVNCARHRREQNIIAYQYHGHIYYRTSQIIRPGRELFVFYGAEFAAKLNIDLRNYNKSPAQLLRLMGKMSTKHQDSDMRDAPTNLADSLNATLAELRRVNACIMIKVDQYFNKPTEDLKQRETDYLSMLESINDLERTNILRIYKGNTVSDESNVSFTSKNDSAIILDNNNYQEFTNENDDSKETENNETKEKCDSTARPSWKCGDCNELLPSRDQLRIHKRKHGPAQKFNCGLCGYTTDVKHYYRRHELSHAKCKADKPKDKNQNEITPLFNWRCEECPEVFKARAELRRHRRNHAGAGALRFKCEICDYKTDVLFYFERHKRSYHRVPVKILKCDRCNFSSVNSKAFKNHCALHGNVAAIRCDRCSYMSARAQDVRAHFSRAHASLRRVCRICARTFSCDDYLRRHMKSMHAKEVLSR